MTPKVPARLGEICADVATGGFFLLLLMAMLALGLSRGVNHDEIQHLAAGAVFGRHGLLPYHDFPWLHMPNLVLLYGILFRWCGRMLLSARLVSVAAGWLTAVLVWAIVRRECREKEAVLRWLLPAAAVMLLVSNPIFREAYWRTWNHAVATLFAVAAVMAALRGGRGWGWAGVFLGLAIGTRVSFAPLLAPLVAAAMLHTGSGEIIFTARLKRAGVFCGGTAAGLSPAIVLCAMAPAQFVFGVFTFNSKVNILFRQSYLDQRITLHAKLLFPFKVLLADKSNALLAALFAAMVIAAAVRVFKLQGELRCRLLLVLGLIPFALIGAVAASPSQQEYYYPVVPLMVLAIGMAAAGLSGGRARWIGAGLIPAAALVTTAWSWHQYPGLAVLRKPSKWTTGPIHDAGVELRQCVPAGRVLTLEPLEPLEGGLDIYPALVTGGIAWRCERFVSPEDRVKLEILGPDNFAASMERTPPSAVLTNPRSAMDQPLVDWAQTHGYAAHPVAAHGKLVDAAVIWVRPQPKQKN